MRLFPIMHVQNNSHRAKTVQNVQKLSCSNKPQRTKHETKTARIFEAVQKLCKNCAECARTFLLKQATTGKTWDRKGINSGESVQEFFPNVQKLSALCRNCVSGQKPMLKNQTSGVSWWLCAGTLNRRCRHQF